MSKGRSLSRLLAVTWSAPTTFVGILAALASASLPSPSNGILLSTSSRGFARWFLSRRGYCAITLGHLVIMTPDAPPEIISHERVHVRQCEHWGPFFIPAYLLATLAIRIRGGNPYWDNPFEVEARRQSSSTT